MSDSILVGWGGDPDFSSSFPSSSWKGVIKKKYCVTLVLLMLLLLLLPLVRTTEAVHQSDALAFWVFFDSFFLCCLPIKRSGQGKGEKNQIKIFAVSGGGDTGR